MSQLVELNAYVDDMEEMGYNVYGISPSDPGSHEVLVEGQGLQFDVLTDVDGNVGQELGFIDLDAQQIFRGYTAVNAETGEMITEVDYLVGENSDEILEKLEDL
nr:redoxin domain-containing protein [Salipaludibacillus daqingensis]